MAGRDEPYIELTLSNGHDMTYEGLKTKCCSALGVDPANVERVRKMPDVRLRSDADVRRFNQTESIEIVLY